MKLIRNGGELVGYLYYNAFILDNEKIKQQQQNVFTASLYSILHATATWWLIYALQDLRALYYNMLSSDMPIILVNIIILWYIVSAVLYVVTFNATGAIWDWL